MAKSVKNENTTRMLIALLIVVAAFAAAAWLFGATTPLGCGGGIDCR